jgi:hypothetical protein
MTQRDLADSLAVRVWTVDRFETGDSDPIRYLPAIAEVTRRLPEWFAPDSLDAVSPEASATAGRDEHVRHGLVGRDIVLGAIILLVTIRFFTEVVPIVPRAANFIDVPLVLVLVLAAMTLRSHAQSLAHRSYVSFATPMLIFVAIAALSTLLNLGRVAPGPVLVFIYGFTAPIFVYAATYVLWPVRNAASLSRLFIWLGITQFIVVLLIDLPLFLRTHNPDYISGTFGTNQYQYVFFMLIVAAMIIAGATVGGRVIVSWFAPVMLVGIVASIILAQYRALLLTMFLTFVMLGLVLGRRGRGRGVLVVVIALGAFGVLLSVFDARFPTLKSASVVSTLRQDPTYYIAKRFDASITVRQLYNDEPQAILYGTGPGTFSSRAWQTFAKFESRSHSNVQGQYASAIMGGEIYSTDVSDRYVAPQLREELISGSRAVTTPYSSYLSLLAEVGLIGFCLMAGIYLTAFTVAARLARASFDHGTSSGSAATILVAATAAFFVLIQMGFLENWLEVTRVTFIAWILLAVGLKEHRASRVHRLAESGAS